MTVVVDASIALKWFLSEARSDAARALLSSSEPMVAPDLLLAEVANGLWRHHALGAIGEADVLSALRSLPALFTELTATGALVEEAAAAAMALRHPVHDCLYLVAAERWSAALVTDDARLRRVVRGTPWAVRLRTL